MRVPKFVLFGLIVLTGFDFSVRADETFAKLKVGSDVYTHVTVTSATATDIYFTSDQGMANAKLKNLDPEMQKHFHFDSAKANAVAQKQRETVALYASLDSPRILDGINKRDAQTFMDAAVTRAKAIINQPVQQYALRDDMPNQGQSYNGWFHPGATVPDFNNVDVRKTRDLKVYSKYTWMTSDVNPGTAFRCADLEFNSMTKYFYVNRSVPKKKLTEAEMLEINHLYRIIGKCEDQGAKLPN